MSKLILLFSTLLMVGCGNSPSSSLPPASQAPSPHAAAPSVTFGPSGSLTFSQCRALIPFGSSSAQQLFAGVSACASSNQMEVVKLKVSANFSTTARFCLVPYSNFMSYPETCFTINGQADIQLSAAAFTHVTLVAESNLTAYKAYLLGNSPNSPAAAYAQLR